MTYTRQIAFADRAVEVVAHPEFGKTICEALFMDVPQTSSVAAHHRFEISVDENGLLLLNSGDTTLYRGDNQADLASHLVGEVIYHLCDLCDSGLVLHAAALHRPGMTLAMPAESGSGKTTLTGFLLTRGFAYLTDELIHVPTGTRTVNAFTRPLNFKRPAFEVIQQAMGIDCEADDSLAGSWASLVPHRKASSAFRAHSPELTHLVFPKFSRDEPAELTEVSPARAAMYLMGCLVNARNLPGHGFEEVTRLARTVSAVSVRYPDFDSAERLLLPRLAA